jgi:N-acetylmuramoyl-L-alanine amidase
MGYQVYLTRTKDQRVNTPQRDLNRDGKIDKIDEFNARTQFANRHHADVFVSIHFDGSTDPSLHGTHGYYCPDRPFWQKNKTLAVGINRTLITSLKQAGYTPFNRGVETDVADPVPQARPDYPWFLVLGPSRAKFMVGSGMPGALMETLFLSSPSDVAALRRPAIIAAAARGYANGIQAYFRAQGRH